MAINAEFSATTAREGFAPFTVNFQDQTTGGTPVYRRWNFGDGTQAENIANPSHTYNDEGIYNVILHVRDALNNVSTEIKSQYIIANGVYPLSENTIIQSQEAGTSPSWVVYGTYLEDDFSSGSIGSQYSTDLQSNWQVVLEGGNHLAIDSRTVGGITDLLPSMQMVSGDFSFEFDMIDRSFATYPFVPGFVARFGWTGPYVSFGRWPFTSWGLHWRISATAASEYVPFPYSAGTRIKLRMTRINGTVTMEYNIGSGWNAFLNTYYNTSDVRIRLKGCLTGPGFDLLNLQAQSGFSTASDPSKYWRFYIDENLHILFRRDNILYKTIDPAAVLDKWMLLEFHPGDNFVYIATAEEPRRVISSEAVDLESIPTVDNDRIFVVKDSSMQVDEIKMWRREENLRDYYRQLKAKAYLLDQA